MVEELYFAVKCRDSCCRLGSPPYTNLMSKNLSSYDCSIMSNISFFAIAYFTSPAYMFKGRIEGG